MNLGETTLFVTNEDTGFWKLGIACDLDTLINRQLAAPYPAQLDSTWMKTLIRCATGQIVGFPPGTVRCVAVDSLCETPAGRFRCHVYHEQYDVIIFGQYDIYTYYAPNVGLVATVAQAGGLFWKSLLSSYELR
jgi:hypothetical protein